MIDVVTRLINAPLPVRRAVAVLLLVGSVCAVGAASYGAAASLSNSYADISEKRETAGRLKVVAELKQSLAEGARSQEGGLSDGQFLEGESEAVIRGNLQSRLNAISTGNGVTVLSAGNVPTLEMDDIRYVGLRADISGPIEGIHNTIFEIETSQPPLIIREASIWLSSGENGTAGPPQISAQIRVYGALDPESRSAQ